MRKVALGIIALLLIAFISGCISQTQTVTVTKTVTNTAEEKATTSQAESGTMRTSTPKPTTTTTTKTKEGVPTTWQVVPRPKSCENWRDNLEVAIYCALDPAFIRQLRVMLRDNIAPNATTPAEKVYYVLSYGTINLALDTVKENKSMEIGHYYDIKTPFETLDSRSGSRADLALLYAGFFLVIFNESYIYYSITLDNQIDAEAGFDYQGIHYTTLWPYPFPLPLTQYERLAAMYGHAEIHDVIAYRIKLQYPDEIIVEKRLIPIEERAQWDSEFHRKGLYLTHKNLKRLQEDINKLFRQALQSNGLNLEYNSSIKYDYQSKRITHRYPLGAFFYSEPFHKEFATGMLISFLASTNAGKEVPKYSKYYIEVETSLDDILITLYLR
ncbi:hypothetical protein DRN41_04505 [Thermococci archaeon]|nr:MAG: hypothetical protein DRN41_04505 [Thermococci archaeon]